MVPIFIPKSLVGKIILVDAAPGNLPFHSKMADSVLDKNVDGHKMETISILGEPKESVNKPDSLTNSLGLVKDRAKAIKYDGVTSMGAGHAEIANAGGKETSGHKPVRESSENKTLLHRPVALHILLGDIPKTILHGNGPGAGTSSLGVNKTVVDGLIHV